jgi:signal transduction histidine kinase
MVNAWTWGLLAGIAAATVLTFLLARALKRSRRAAALGALLVPVTGLWLWAFGITAEDQQTVTTQSFSTMIAVGKAARIMLSPARIASLAAGSPNDPVAVPVGTSYVALDPGTGAAVASGKVIEVFPAGQPMSLVTTVSSSPAATFWMGMCILGVMALVAVVASRQAGYVAGIGLAAFGLYQLIAVALFSPGANGTAWYDWLYGMTSRGPVCGVAVGSVVAGLVLIRYTVVHDMLQRMTLASRVELLTQTRAEAVDAAAAELRRLERDLHDGAQARLVAIGLSLRALEPAEPGRRDRPRRRVPGCFRAGPRRPA